jgi:hypothetical protein
MSLLPPPLYNMVKRIISLTPTSSLPFGGRRGRRGKIGNGGKEK